MILHRYPDLSCSDDQLGWGRARIRVRTPAAGMSVSITYVRCVDLQTLKLEAPPPRSAGSGRPVAHAFGGTQQANNDR